MIVVFGSINVDLFFGVATLPRPGETVLCTEYVTWPGGKGANQAVAAARAGAGVRMIGAVGTDAHAGPVLEAIDATGVDTSHVVRVPGVTGTAIVMVEESAENQIVVASGANLQARAEHVPDRVLGPGTTLVVQLEVPIAEIQTVLERSRRAGSRTVLNAAPAQTLPQGMLETCDVIVANRGEADVLAGAARDAPAQVRTLADRYGCDCIITLGDEGAVLASGGGLFRLGSLDIRPVDTVGAGDAFVGVLAAQLDAGDPLLDAARYASVAAGLACLEEGAQMRVPAADIERALGQLAPAQPA